MKTIVNRITIEQIFGTDSATTHRILMNCNWGFFVRHFPDAKEKWDEFHPFKYSAHNSINYHEKDMDFIKKHFDLFAGKQFSQSSGWEWNETIQKYDWRHRSYYIDASPTFKPQTIKN